MSGLTFLFGVLVGVLGTLGVCTYLCWKDGFLQKLIDEWKTKQ